MKVNIYARVSTDDKDQNPDRQLIQCRRYCELHEHEILQETIEYYTGNSDPFKRPEGSKLLDNNPQGIVMASMDRLTREHPVKVIQMINNLKNQGVKIISVTEPAFNMESEFADILHYLISWFNNYFLTKLKRDVKAGLDRARAQGKIIGRPKVKFNEHRAAYLLYVKKKTQREVSRELGVSLATICRFKKVLDKNPTLFINKSDVPKTDVSETFNHKEANYNSYICPNCNKKQMRWRVIYNNFFCGSCRTTFNKEFEVIGGESI